MSMQCSTIVAGLASKAFAIRQKRILEIIRREESGQLLQAREANGFARGAGKPNAVWESILEACQGASKHGG
jgi:hypothetical protein